MGRRPEGEWYDVLERNLSALGGISPEAVDPIRFAEPTTVEWIDTPEGPTASYQGRLLASRQPKTEARKLAGAVDILENAVVVVPGFGLGYHVEAIARRMQLHGAIIVYEPDVGLLQEVLSTIDHSWWLAGHNVMILTEFNEDIALKPFQGILTLLAIGLTTMDHPAQRARLRPHLPGFYEGLRGGLVWARVMIASNFSLVRQTTLNQLMNLDTYVLQNGIKDLAGCMAVDLPPPPEPVTLDRPQEAAQCPAEEPSDAGL